MKKGLALTLAAAITTTLMGCSAGTGGQTTAAPETKAPETAAQTTADTAKSDEQAAPEAAALSGDLHYVSMFNEAEPQSDVIKAAIEEFATTYPDVNITVDWMGRETLKTIKASLEAGQVDIWDQAINQVIVNYNDYGYELSELMDKPSPVLGGKTYNDVANPTLIEAVKQFAPDGKVHALPNIPNVVAFFYNQDQFDQAGVTDLPETWDELLAVCQKLKDAGITPISVDDGYIILPFAMYLGHLKGIDFNAKLVNDASGALWDDPAVKQAAEAMQELWDKGYISKNAASNKYPAGQNEVAMGDAAMYLVASYMLNEVREITGDDFNWGAFSFPVPESSVLPNTANSIGMNVMQISKECKNPDLAFQFITFLTTGKYDSMMSEQCNSIPNAADTEYPPLLSCAKPVLEATTENVVYGFKININSNFTPIYKEQAQKLLGGQTDAAGFIEACKSAVTAK